MKRVHVLMAAVLLAAFGTFPRIVSADVIDIDPDSFAAVSYSPSTGEFHYAFGFPDRWTAQQEALRVSPAKDASIVGWVNEGFLALALGDDKSAWGTGYSYGDGSSSRAAEDTAIEECQKRTTGAHVVICLSSDGQHFYKPTRRPTPTVGGAAAKPQPGGTLTKNADGSSVETRADGTVIVTNKDGSSMETRADGSTIIKNANGSSMETKADGTIIVTNKDGSKVQTNPDGSQIITDSNGVQTVKKAGEKTK